MSTNRNREVRDFIEKIKKRGWKAEPSKNGHFRLTHPRGGLMFIPYSPSCHRWRKNAESQIRGIEKQQEIRA